MTCQRCDDEASVHLTETVDGRRREVHLCKPCARKAGMKLPDSPPALALDAVVQDLIVTHVGELVGELADLACPECGTRFMEFRSRGRLGCPRDYEVFRDELMPLLENIHDETRHSGKVPRRAPRNTQQQTTLIQLRNDLKRAVAAEDYETAARIRDQIKSIEHEQGR